MAHPELLRAAQADAAGDHDGAINALARGAGLADAGCMAALGLRLATGDRAPLLVSEGLGLLADAAERGEPAAAARGAALIGLGHNLPRPEWKLALRWLARSAQLGHDAARRQLRALCDDRAMASARDIPSAGWSALAAAIDLAQWQRAPAARELSADPRVHGFDALLRPELCAFLISLAPGHLAPARVYDPVARADIVVAHRSNTQAVFGTANIELAQVLVQSRLAAACGQPVEHMEAPATLHYEPGQQIADHFDFVDPDSTPDYADEIARNGQRLITFLVYLNHSYEAGETEFPLLGIRNKGRTGDGLFFVNALADLSPDRRTLHAGRPPVRGEKWLMTQFVRSRTMRPQPPG